jgi:Flp pilus assembly pilin Flp
VRNTKWLEDDSGQDLVEYAFLVLFIALFCAFAMQHLGVAINTTYMSVRASLGN